MIRVRRHNRQLATGKTVAVRQHERNVAPASTGIQQPGEDAWWENPPPVPEVAEDPEGTWYFRQDDQLMAVHPDGTVHGTGQTVDHRQTFREAWRAATFKGCTPDQQEGPADRALAEMKAEMREWRNRPVPSLPPQSMTPQMAKLMGCTTPEGREKYERLRAYRLAGYSGPLGPDNRIPDPDEPGMQSTLETLAHMRANCT